MRSTARSRGWTRGKRRDELIAALIAAGVPSAPVRTVEELIADPEMARRGMLLDSELSDSRRDQGRRISDQAIGSAGARASADATAGARRAYRRSAGERRNRRGRTRAAARCHSAAWAASIHSCLSTFVQDRSQRYVRVRRQIVSPLSFSRFPGLESAAYPFRSLINAEPPIGI